MASYPKQDLFETELAAAITDATSLTFNVVTSPEFALGGDTVYAVIDPDGDYEAVEVSGISGTVITVSSRGLPKYEGGPSTASTHPGGKKVIITNHWKTFKDVYTALDLKAPAAEPVFTGSMTVPIYADDAARDAAITSPVNGMTIYNTADGEFQDYTGGIWASRAAGSTPNASETVAGKVEQATIAEQIAGTETGGTSAPLFLNPKYTVSEHDVYTSAFLTGGSNAESTPATWASLGATGKFNITIDGVAYIDVNPDFTGDATMDDVAASIQTAIQTATSSTETCIWDTDHFIISSVDTTSSSAITVASSPATGTDISGAGVIDAMDCDTGNGIVTDKVLDKSAKEGYTPKLNSSGEVPSNMLPLDEVVPPAMLTPYAGATAPTGWLLCDGTAYDASSDATLTALYAIIGNTYGGTDNTDFQVPDLRGRFPLGKDNMGGSSANRVTNAQADTLGGSEGEENHTLTEAEMPSHTHTVNSRDGGGSNPGYLQESSGNDTVTTNATGGGGAHNNMPPYLTLNYIIKK